MGLQGRPHRRPARTRPRTIPGGPSRGIDRLWGGPAVSDTCPASAHALPSPPPSPRLRPLRTRGDEALRSLAAAGDARAFAVLYERHQHALYRYCRSIVQHDEDARDALHNTMANAWAALLREDRDVPVRAWLFRIAHNEAITVLRRRRPLAELEDAGELPGTSLDDEVERRAQLALLRSDLAALPERQRAALVLRELSGLGHEEIAAVIGGTAATAKQVIYEARAALHAAAQGRAMSCADVQRMLSDGDGRVRRGRKVRAHLRQCGDCLSFGEALRGRPAQLAALAPPLPVTGVAALLARLASASGASGTAAKLGGGVTAKVLVGAVLATTSATIVDVELRRPEPASRSPRPAAAGAVRSAPSPPLTSSLAARHPHATTPHAAPPPARRHAGPHQPTPNPPSPAPAPAQPATAPPAPSAAPRAQPPGRPASPPGQAQRPADKSPPPGLSNRPARPPQSPPGRAETPPGRTPADPPPARDPPSGVQPGPPSAPPGQGADHAPVSSNAGGNGRGNGPPTSA
jgi:RNA polymerase sigma factor (sigma-70 family)